MITVAPHSALRYDASIEQRQEDEPDTAAVLVETMRRIQETTYADYGHAVRSVHAKSHGLLEGELRVLDHLPEVLAQGLFAKPATYPVVLRLSTNPGDVLDDSVSAPRGLAVKVIGVEGERLPGSEGEATQDFVMANAPAFAAPDTKTFATNLKLLAATTDTGQAWKKAFSAALRGVEAALETAGGESALLKTMGGQPLTHPLGESFYTQVPLRYGDYVAKLAIVPASPELRALAGAPLEIRGKPNGLREAVIDFFRHNGAVWEVRVQLRTNPRSMPIEDASVLWPEDESPYMPVAQITVPPQAAWSEARAQQVDDGLAFSPWHGLMAHLPLGSVNRARQRAYDRAAEFRAEHNGCPIHEPRRRMNLSAAPAETYGSPGREGRRDVAAKSRGRASGAPGNETLRHAAAGAAGGLASGLMLSGVMLGMQRASGQPSELVRLERRTAGRAGLPHRSEDALPTLGEQWPAHAGHLLLSAAAGAGYGLMKRDGASPVAAGLAFGMGFYALTFGVVGPALQVTPKPWRDRPSSLVQHGLMHVLFGLATGLLTERIARRL